MKLYKPLMVGNGQADLSEQHFAEEKDHAVGES
jgi:hypothetical protein